MGNYRSYAVIPLFIIFICLGYLRYKNYKEYQKETGINFHSFRDTFKLFFNPPRSEAYRSAFDKFNKSNLKLYLIWFITVLIFIIIISII